ncbi:MAG: dTDP-4-dehydrorhamnose 3,5-epimerase [Acidithiobacillus sp.]
MIGKLEKDISEAQLIEPNDSTTDPDIYSENIICDLPGKNINFAEEEDFRLKQGELLGLYYQVLHLQGTLISVRHGKVYCVAVDVRKGSPSLGRWISVDLSEENNKRLWIPEGFARGWLSLVDETVVNAKYTKRTMIDCQRCIACNDSSISIKWPLIPYEYPIAIGHSLSVTDKKCPKLHNAELIEIGV